jgi:DNA-binding NtrC family response regulator
VMNVFKSYAWPGNVRELKNAIELVTLLRAGKKVRLRDLPTALVESVPRVREVVPGDRLEVSLDRPLDESLLEIVRAAVAREAGNRTRAAERLGISVRTIQRYLAQEAPLRVAAPESCGLTSPV